MRTLRHHRLAAAIALALGTAVAAAQVQLDREPLQLQMSVESRQPAAAAGNTGAGAREVAPYDLPPSIVDTGNCAKTTQEAAERALKLVDVIRAVVCQNAGVRQGPGLSRQAQAALLRARAAWQPGLSAALRAGTADDDPSALTRSVRLEWLLYDFGSRRAALAQSQESLQGVRGEQATQALTAVAQAAQLHATAMAAFSRFDAAAANMRIAQDSLRLAEARQAAGAATLGDKLQAQTAFAQSRLEHTRAMTQWLTARSSLSAAMGLPANTNLLLSAQESVELLEKDAPLDLKALADEARREHPRVLAARARLAEARHRQEGLKAEHWGKVSFNARAARGRTVADGSPLRDNSATVEWSVPLLDRGVLRSQEMEAGGQIMVREVALDDAEQQVSLQVWQDGQALLGERQNSRASREVFETAQASLRAATERYRLGAGSFADLLAAQSAAASARLQRVESQARLLQAHLQLAAAVGRFGESRSAARDPARR